VANRPTINAELLLNEVWRNQQSHSATVLRRDVREVGVAVLMVPGWIYLGVRLALSWGPVSDGAGAPLGFRIPAVESVA
jgi:hypothetical protein